MRDIKTLLELLLDQYQNNKIYRIQWAGLCLAIIKLHNAGVIDQSDKESLLNVIEANRPESAGPFCWWPEGEVEPRVEFLKKLISEL